MSARREREVLVEQAAGAWRPVRVDGSIGALPAWADLDDAGRAEAFEAARLSRRLEAALDGRGWSSTVKAVVGRIRGER
jgi:hypothetical protein